MSLGRAVGMGPPPAAHDPADRVRRGELFGWEIRAHPPNSLLHDWCAEHEALHLQLWHARRGISVLTPSLLTAGSFEIYPVCGWRVPIADPWLLGDVIDRAFALPFPGPCRIRALERWFLRATAGARLTEPVRARLP